MSIVRWDPFRELEDMSDRLNRMFGRGELGRLGKDAMISADWAHAVDITETPEEFVIKADLPDINKEDVKVSVENDMLRITGERKQEKEEKSKKMHRVERYHGTFMRAFTLPDNVDSAKLQAKYANGVLTVNLPKTEKAKPKPVEIKVS